MISEEVIDKVVERLVNRIEEGNTYVLKKIGESIKKVGTLTATSSQELYQLIRYGGDYDEIVNKLAEITELNVKDIYEIFDEVAKTENVYFEKFYKYRNKKFIPYEYNTTLQNQVRAIANLTANNYMNISRTMAFARRTPNGIIYTDLSKTYQDVLDKAILSVSQGKTTFQDEMYSTIKELASSGLKTVDYASGRSMRLDSAVRMNIKGGLRELHNETQKIYGDEFGADMVEISVHSHPADDHLMQGHQFMIEEFNKLQNGEEAKDLKGRTYTLDHDGNGSYRPISTMNCYHYVFYGIAGVSKQEYSDEELQKIIDENEKGFEYENNHYSLYEGEQLLRKIELELRKAKDEQIMGRASGIVENVGNAQSRITMLTQKYNEVLKASGLPSKLDRARVPGYRRVNVKNLK